MEQKMVNDSTYVSDDDACRRILLEHEREREGKLRDIAASLTQPRVRRIKPRTSEPTRDVVDAANAAYQDKFVSLEFLYLLKDLELSFYIVIRYGFSFLRFQKKHYYYISQE